MNSFSVSRRASVPLFLRRRELPFFFLLAYLLSWWSAPLAQGGLLPHGPALAAIITLAIMQGKPGLRALWGRCANWRGGWWYLIGPAVIIAFLLVAYLLAPLLGATPTGTPRLPAAGILLNLLLLGGLWEEPGWTGYALHTLQERFAGRPHGILFATLLTGLGRGFWHVPLVLYGTITWYDALFFSLALQVIITWVYNGSGGSVPAVMATHFASNVLIGSTMLLVFSGSDRNIYYVLFVTSACLAALLILWQTRYKLGYAPEAPSIPPLI